MCIRRTPQCARAPAGQDARRARHLGCVSLVTFFAQAKKVTRSPAGRVEALLLNEEKRKLDSSLRWNDEEKRRAEKRPATKKATGDACGLPRKKLSAASVCRQCTSFQYS